MKFTFPDAPVSAHFFLGVPSLRRTWEYRVASAAVAAQLIIGITTILWFWRRLPPAVPLWYSRPWGEGRLASPWFLLLPLGTAGIIYGLNLAMIVRFSADHPMFTRVLLLTSCLISCLSVILVVRIVTLVG
jgi:hypothetical protein